jgi:hypothetical protein
MTNLSTSIRNLVIGLLLVVVAFGAYFFIYIRQREDLMAQHNLRLLVSSVSYATDALEGLLENVETAISIGPEDIPADSTVSKPDTTVAPEAIAKKLSLIKELSGLRLSDSLQVSTILKDTNAVIRVADKRSVNARIAIVLDVLASEPRLIFVFSRPWKSDTMVLTRETNLQERLGPALPVGIFDHVVVARANGDVLLEQGASHLRLRNLVLPGEVKEKVATTVKPAEMPISSIYNATIAGQRYKLFVQPMPLPIPINFRSADRRTGWYPEDHWFVVGFVPLRVYRARMMAVPPTVVMAVLFVFVLGVLSLPILKVRYIGAREELRQLDAPLLALSVIVGAVIVCFAILFFVLHQREADRAENDVRSLSKAITHQLTRELERLDATLVDLTNVRFRDQERLRTAILSAGRQIWRPRDSVDVLAGDVHRAALSHPFFELAIWMSDNERQTSKWTIRDVTTPLSGVDQREYFRQPNRGLLWNDSTARDSNPFTDGRFVESIRSRSTGQEFAILSRRLKSPFTPGGADKTPPIVVAAISSRLMSVISPVLPPGQGFAIVDRTGLVQFHSDRIRNVRENLFQELGSDHAVRSAVEKRGAAITRSTYRTVPSVIHVSPIPDTPWALVVFREVDSARKWLLQVVTLSLAVTTIHLLAIAIVAVAVFVFWPAAPRPGEVRRWWFWPDRKHRRAYQKVLTISAVIGLACVVSVATGWAPLILSVSFLASLIAIALFFVGLRRKLLHRVPHPRWLRRVPTRTLHVAMFTSLVLLIGVLPALGYFRVVHDEEVIAHLKGRQLEFAESLERRRLDGLDWYRDVRLSGAARESISADVLGRSSSGEPFGYYSADACEWCVRPEGGPPCNDRPSSSSRQRILKGILRILSREGTPGAWLESETADSTYHWYRRGHGPLFCSARFPMSDGTLGVESDSPSRSTRFQVLDIKTNSHGLGAMSILSGWWLVSLLALINVVHVALGSIFPGAWTKPQTLSWKDIVDKEVSNHPHPPASISRAILLRFQLEDAEKTKWYVVGIHEIRAAKSARKLLLDFLDVKEQKKGIVLTQFDQGLREPDIICRKLDLLEALNALDRNDTLVYIESAIEPIYFLAARFHEHYGDEKANVISLERWSIALQYFVRLRTDLAKDWVEELEGLGLSDPVKRTLIDEGSVNSAVRKLAVRLARHKDLKDHSPEEIIQLFLDQAKAHYRRLWVSCSSEEKLLLHRIAKQGLVNRNAEEILRPLISRGLVRKDPNYRIMNESFRRFILNAEPADAFAKWEERGETSPWARMRGPIGFAAIVLAILFFYSQREAFNETLGVLAGFAAAAPALIRLFGTIGKGEAVKN